MKISLSRIIVCLILISGITPAKGNDILNLSTEELKKNELTFLTGIWKYRAGSNDSWAHTEFNDDAWEQVDRQSISKLKFESEWQGTGWFRKWVNVDSSLVNKILGLRIRYVGAYEFYLNGKKFFNSGVPNTNINEDIALKDFSIKAFNFVHPDSNLIAIKFSNHELEFFNKAGIAPGLSVSIGDYERITRQKQNEDKSWILQLAVLISISLILALLHVFLFIFNTKTKSNLYYVIFLVCFSLYMYLNLHVSITGTNWEIIALFIRLNPMMLTMTILFGSTAAYSIFSDLPKIYPVVFITAVVIGLAGFVLYDRWVFYIVYTFIVIISPPTGHKIFLKRNDNLGGEWVIRSGFLVMSAAGIYQMFLSFGWVPPIFGIYVVYFYGVLGFIVSMSILLARDFAVTNKYLELQLENVQQLSDKTLKQELEKKELETRDKILEADNQRKTRELEDARKLQLSMLPQSLPDIANLKIAAYMSTATEVGGDYYDFIKSKDGTLNIAVGDATGHGMKAGTMVASIKSLFAALGGSMMIPDFFNKCTEIIKSMKLGNLFMSMTILRIKGNYLIASSAGMPPMKICRDQKNKIDDIILKGMPLGAFAKYDYIEYEEELNEGDTIILMSDGLPELFNSKKEMLGDNRINQVIIDYIDKSPQEIIDAMVEVGEKWRGETAQEDDITLIVIKFV